MLKSKVAERLIEDGEELSCMRLELGFTTRPVSRKLAVEFLTLLGES
jgi:hypothetical protein